MALRECLHAPAGPVDVWKAFVVVGLFDSLELAGAFGAVSSPVCGCVTPCVCVRVGVQ